MLRLVYTLSLIGKTLKGFPIKLQNDPQQLTLTGVIFHLILKS